MIVTFYSFKGGVGRSMALANVAELLIARGLSVLMIDFDLEAPGLERFFDESDPDSIQAERGLIDLLVSYKELRALPVAEGSPRPPDEDGGFPYPVEPLRNFVAPIVEASEGGRLLLIPAGRRDGTQYMSYADRIRAFDWDEFYARWDGEEFFEWFRREAERLADIVLIDSRTGITELSGVSTFQLADVVVMFIAPNEQNLDGCELIAKSLQNEELIAKGRGGRALRLLPVPSRVDNSESVALQKFATDYEQRFVPFLPGELTFENTPFIDLKVPYVPAYAFRETVAVREPGRAVATELIAAYGRLTSALVELAPETSRIYRDFHTTVELDELEAAPVDAAFTGRDWLVERVNAWLESSSEPLMLVTGEPGSGKTAFVQWLSRQPADAPVRLAARVVYTHLCRAKDGGSLDPRLFVQTLAKRLAPLIPGYASRLLTTQHGEISVEVRKSISATRSSELSLGNVSVGSVSAEVAFDELISRPLEKARPELPLLVLVDGLDAAGAPRQPETIVDLVQYVSGSRPPNLRFLVTSRPDRRLLYSLRGEAVDLIADSPGVDDIRRYVERRLAELGRDGPEGLADAVVEASGGNFLFAELALERVQQGIVTHPRDLVTATSLEALLGELGSQLSELELPTSHYFLLAILAVAHSAFSVGELAGISRMPPAAVEDALATFRAFLRVGSDGRVRLFHSAFAELLLRNPSTTPHVANAHVAIVRFLLEEHDGPWTSATDEYALDFAVGHLLEALEGAAYRTERQGILAQLIQLATDEAFLTSRVARVGPSALSSDFDKAARLAPALTKLPYLADSLHEALHRIAQILADEGEPDDPERFVELLMEAVVRHVASAYGRAYEKLREKMPPSRERTATMSGLLAEVGTLAEVTPGVTIEVATLLRGTPGDRIVGLAVLQVRPDPDVFDSVTEMIAGSLSAFEQFHALNAARRLLPIVGPEARYRLAAVLDAERRDVRGLGIRNDTSRWSLINDLLLQVSDAPEKP